jgi:hypothetical protein
MAHGRRRGDCNRYGGPNGKPVPIRRWEGIVTDGVGREPGWPREFPVNPDGTVDVGIVVLSRSGTIEGRTTGNRRPCQTLTCSGWFIGVQWETGQLMYPCSMGWTYDPSSKTVRITAGGEISARDPEPPAPQARPAPRGQWPSRADLTRRIGWRDSTHGI